MRQTASHKPLVSIGLPVFNGERFLAESLDSLCSQSFSDFEIIISDNASEDGTRGISQTYARRDSRIRYFRQVENFGAAFNYNFVFKKSSGKYFKWASHDDRCDPDFLLETTSALQKDTDACLAYTDVVNIDVYGNVIDRLEQDVGIDNHSAVERLRAFFRYYHYGREANAVFGLVRRDSLARTGLIGAYPSSDIVLLANLALLGKWVHVPRLLFFRRYHDDMSIKANPTILERARWFDTSITSHREGKLLRLFKEHLRVIGHARLGFSEKVAGYLQVLRWAWGRKRPLFRQFVGTLR